MESEQPADGQSSAPMGAIPLSTLAGMPEFQLNDVGNADRLAFYFGNDLRYCEQMKGWYHWDGKRWVEDADREVFRRAEQVVRLISEEARINGRNAEALIKHAAKSLNAREVKNMVEMAKHKLPVQMEAFDTNLWLLNCANGTVNLRTGKLHPHRREDYITKLVPVYYDPEAQCPEFLKFMASIMANRGHLIDFLQKAIGYSLSGSTKEQCLFMCFGAGSNGKSTLLELQTELFADYARTCPTESLMQKKADAGIPNDIARLRGSRFVSAIETGEDRRLNEVLVKQLTGGDTITARFLHKEFFEFKPQFKVFLATNHKPIIKGVDNAIWRRLHLIPFEVKFWNPDKDETGPPETMMNKELPGILRSELPGILRWCVDGCLMWQEKGLKVPQEIKAQTAEYRKAMDTLGEFIDENCYTTSTSNEPLTVTSKRLYNAYARWCDNAGEISMTKKAFGQRLQERGFENGRSTDGKDRIWKGITLNETYDPPGHYNDPA